MNNRAFIPTMLAPAMLILSVSAFPALISAQGRVIMIQGEGAETAPPAAAVVEAEAPVEVADKGQHVTEKGDLVNLAGDVDVPEDMVVDGNVMAVDGSAHIRGKVKGSVNVTRGSAFVYNRAEVRGNVVAEGGEIKVDNGASVGGTIRKLDAPPEPAAPVEPPEPPEPPTPPESPPTPEPPAWEPLPERHISEVVAWGSPVTIHADEIVDGDVSTFGGPLKIEGKVNGDVASFGGPVTVIGEVTGDIASMGGPVALKVGSKVHGDVNSWGGPVSKDPGSWIGGRSTGTAPWPGPLDLHELFRGPIGTLGKGVSWVFLTLSILLITALVALAAPRATHVMAKAIDEQPGRVVLHGIVGWLLAFPILLIMVILCITWILIPFYLLLIAAALLVGGVGVSLFVGQRLTKMANRRVHSLLALAVIGALGLRIAGLVEILPAGDLVSALIMAAVATLALGSAILTKFGTDPTGTWLGKKAHAQPGNGDTVYVPYSATAGTNPTAPGNPGPEPPVEEPIVDELDEVTREALNQLPRDEGEDEEAEQGDGPTDDAPADATT